RNSRTGNKHARIVSRFRSRPIAIDSNTPRSTIRAVGIYNSFRAIRKHQELDLFSADFSKLERFRLAGRPAVMFNPFRAPSHAAFAAAATASHTLQTSATAGHRTARAPAA